MKYISKSQNSFFLQIKKNIISVLRSPDRSEQIRNHYEDYTDLDDIFKSRVQQQSDKSFRKANVSCGNDDVDIAFLVDCTRSMRRHVLRTKANIGHIVKNIRKRFNNQVRLAFVAYRDLQCPNNIQEMDFTRKVHEFTSFADRNC